MVSNFFSYKLYISCYKIDANTTTTNNNVNSAYHITALFFIVNTVSLSEICILIIYK